MTLNKYIMIISLCLLFVGCQKNLTEAYLLTHPERLRSEVERCQKNGAGTKEENSHCKMIMNAAVTLMKIINEQQREPEKFGERILSLEGEYIKAKKALAKARQKLEAIKLEAPQDARNFKELQIEVGQLEKNVKADQQNLNTLLAVAGLTSPE